VAAAGGLVRAVPTVSEAAVGNSAGDLPGHLTQLVSQAEPLDPAGLVPQAPGPADSVTIPLAGMPPEVRVDSQNGLVSIVVRSAALNEVLGVLASQLGINIVTAEDITARVSVTLNKVPFEEAMTHILSVAGYTWARQGNVLIVTSVAAGATVAPQAQAREVHVFSLDYVSASDIDMVIQGLLSPAGQSFVTESADTDSRKCQELVVVEDLPSYLDRVEQYIRQVDVPPRQVLIEAHVLAVELEDDAKHGVNLEYLDLRNPSFTLRTQGFADVAKFATGLGPAFFFNVAATDVNALIEALETTTDAKTLATPKVLALNGQRARIQIGEKLGYRVTTTTQTSSLESVDFLDVGVLLEVTPWITQDNQVMMYVKPEVSTGKINPATELPDEDTTEVETAVMLPDGFGMVIGGLIQEEDLEIQNKIPIVGDLWLVGRLFQHREIERKRTEIIITLVPHVVPYQPTRQQLECDQFHKADTPLTYGPLRQNPRPFEPRFPDAGQHLQLRCKANRFHPRAYGGPWTPGGSGEQCYGGVMSFPPSEEILITPEGAPAQAYVPPSPP
jgi:type II secretory pathway component GspD/PulD (secretin)